MKFTLSVDDYIKLQRYLVKHDPKTSYGFTLRRVISTSTFTAFFLAIAALSGNSVIAIATLVLTLPAWLLSRLLVFESYSSKLEKAIKNNKAYTTEMEVLINNNAILITKAGIEIKIPLSVIEDVIVDTQLIYIKAPDGYRIITICAFSSVAEKEAFLDKLKQKKLT